VSTLSWGEEEHYGWALFVEDGLYTKDKYYDLHFVEHGGDVPGYSADLHFVPSLDFAFIALSNNDDAHYADSWVTALETLANLPPATTAPAHPNDPATFTKFAGTYTDANYMGTVTVTANAGTLSVKMQELDTQKVGYTPALEPLSENNFVFTTSDGYQDVLTFVLDDAGAPAYLRSRGWVAKKGPQAFHIVTKPAFDRERFLRTMRDSTPEVRRVMRVNGLSR